MGLLRRHGASLPRGHLHHTRRHRALEDSGKPSSRLLGAFAELLQRGVDEAIDAVVADRHWDKLKQCFRWLDHPWPTSRPSAAQVDGIWRSAPGACRQFLPVPLQWALDQYGASACQYTAAAVASRHE